jgi:hypothetical protein
VPASTVRLLFGGDVMLGRGVAPIARADPHGLFADVRLTVSNADLAAANLESPLTHRPHTAGTPNALEASSKTARLLARAGFDAMAMANNHAGDAGPGSVTDTIDALRSAGIRPVGGGSNDAEALEPQTFEIRGIRVALLSFDATRQGLRANDTSAGVAWWSTRAARRAVRQARAEADVVVVGLHGGIEYQRGPDPLLTRLGELLAGWGADVVWGTGPHVVQPVSVIDPDGDGRWTVLLTSLGNLLFDQTQPGTQEGALLEILADDHGVIGYRIGSTQDTDRRVHFETWQEPLGDAAALDAEWWNLVRPVAIVGATVQDSLPIYPDARSTVIASAVGDVTRDGEPDIVVSFRMPYLDTAEKRMNPEWPWKDALGQSAHLGVYAAEDLAPIWVAGTIVRPVADVAVCDGALAIAHSTLDDPTVVVTGAWFWNGFGFFAAPELPGFGVPGCADVDRDGRLDPVVTERSSS